MTRVHMVLCLMLAASGAGEVDARRRNHSGVSEKHMAEKHVAEKHVAKPHSAKSHGTAQPAASVAAEDPAAAGGAASSAGKYLHTLLLLVHVALLFYSLHAAASPDKPAAFRRALGAIVIAFTFEGVVHLLMPQPHLSVGVMIAFSVVFTISPLEDDGRPFGLNMGTVPPLCVLWLGASRILSYNDLVRSLYGSDSLRPYHLVVMFLGSVYLCTALVSHQGLKPRLTVAPLTVDHV